MPIDIEGWIALSRKIVSTDLISNEDYTSPPPINFITPISIPLPPLPPATLVPKPKLSMTPEEEHTFISKLLNKTSTFPPEVPFKETIGKLGVMFHRTYALDHPITPLLFDYAQHGCPVDCGRDWTMEQIILMLKRGPHVSDK